MHKLLLEMIVVIALGVELTQMESPSSMSFVEAYHNLLQPSRLSMILWFMNARFPLRWLPLKINKTWLEANSTIQSMIKGVVHRRAEELRAIDRKREVGEDLIDTRRDITTFMLEESLFGKGELSESEIANGVSTISLFPQAECCEFLARS